MSSTSLLLERNRSRCGEPERPLVSLPFVILPLHTTLGSSLYPRALSVRMPNLEEEEFYDQMEDLQEEDEDEEETEDEEDEIEAEEDETLVRSSRVSQNDASTSAQAFISVREDNAVEEREDKRRKTEKGEASSSTNRDESKEGSSGGDWNRTEIDGLFCPICMEAWTSDGDHHVCCLPCGHIYGMSCIKKWLRECRSSGKCPQCNMKCKLKDVRKLYASRIVVVDEESQKKIRSLEAKCASLEKKSAASPPPPPEEPFHMSYAQYEYLRVGIEQTRDDVGGMRVELAQFRHDSQAQHWETQTLLRSLLDSLGYLASSSAPPPEDPTD